MKKKFLAMMCVLACVLSLTACGSEPVEYTDYETSLTSKCESLAYTSLMIAANYSAVKDQLPSLNKEEMATLYSKEMEFAGYEEAAAEFGAFDGLISTYGQMESDMGGLKENGIGDITSEISGKEILVSIKISGNTCDGQVDFIFSNDLFTRFKEGNCVANTSFSQKMDEAGKHMGDAALNTVLGMGTVFFMLIFISLIISLFVVFKKDNKKTETKAPVVNDAPEVTENLADDTELVAVIMAAISAFEGNSSTDGFVVRSIKKANRRN